MAVWRFECTLKSAYLVRIFYWISCIQCGGNTQDVFTTRNKNKGSQNVLFDATPVRVNTKLNYMGRLMPQHISATPKSHRQVMEFHFGFRPRIRRPRLLSNRTQNLTSFVPVINWTLSLWHLMNFEPMSVRKMTNTHRSDAGTEGRFQF